MTDQKSQISNSVRFTFDGRSYEAAEGAILAAALWSAGIRTLRHVTLRDAKGPGDPRGMYCGIGHCYECRVSVDGVPGVRACLVGVREGMVVESMREGKDDDSPAGGGGGDS